MSPMLVQKSVCDSGSAFLENFTCVLSRIPFPGTGASYKFLSNFFIGRFRRVRHFFGPTWEPLGLFRLCGFVVTAFISALNDTNDLHMNFSPGVRSTGILEIGAKSDSCGPETRLWTHMESILSFPGRTRGQSLHKSRKSRDSF